MTATTIRVRVNPSASGEYVIYADPTDTDGQHWLLLGPDGQYDRWEYDEYVADWTEFELRTPPLAGQSADPARSLPGNRMRC